MSALAQDLAEKASGFILVFQLIVSTLTLKRRNTVSHSYSPCEAAAVSSCDLKFRPEFGSFHHHLCWFLTNILGAVFLFEVAICCIDISFGIHQVLIHRKKSRFYSRRWFTEAARYPTPGFVRVDGHLIIVSLVLRRIRDSILSRDCEPCVW
jgi:hypothetical protein